jgi:hypothetical protein
MTLRYLLKMGIAVSIHIWLLWRSNIKLSERGLACGRGLTNVMCDYPHFRGRETDLENSNLPTQSHPAAKWWSHAPHPSQSPPCWPKAVPADGQFHHLPWVNPLEPLWHSHWAFKHVLCLS